MIPTTYRIKFQYLSVAAESKEQAYAKALAMVKSMPAEALVIGVEEASWVSKKPIWRRIVFG